MIIALLCVKRGLLKFEGSFFVERKSICWFFNKIVENKDDGMVLQEKNGSFYSLIIYFQIKKGSLNTKLPKFFIWVLQMLL